MNAQPKERAFGILFGAVFLGIGAVKNFPQFTEYKWFVASFGMVSCAFMFPFLLRPFCWGWLQIGKLLHCVMNPIIMAVFYWGIITPIGLLAKINRTDPLRLQFKTCKSYWIERPARQRTHFKHQF